MRGRGGCWCGRALDEIPSLTVDLVRPIRTITPDEAAIKRYAHARPFVAKAYRALEELYSEGSAPRM